MGYRRALHVASNLAQAAVVLLVTAPVLLLLARLWWEWTWSLLTKPWAEIVGTGNGCLS